MAKIGVDVGGTFTDLILENGPGNVFVHKVPSTPQDQSIGVLAGIGDICKIAGISTEDVELIVHGPPEKCREHIQQYADNGVDTPMIGLLPLGIDPRQAARDLAPR